jgi:SH3 domain-containing YSC84-like protein 1
MKRRSFVGASVASAATLATVTSRSAWAGPDQDELVNKATTTLSHFFRDPDMTWFQNNVGRARAILIAPEIVKAGFIIGGSGGRATLIAKDKNGKWAGPAFYSLATASIGFQAGLQVAEAVTLVMSEKGYSSFMSTSLKFGGDVSIAAGPVGAGAKQDVITDLVSFSRAKGLYGGLNLDGTVVTLSKEWNEIFFGKAVSPADILNARSVSSPKSSKLLRTAAGGAAR